MFAKATGLGVLLLAAASLLRPAQFGGRSPFPDLRAAFQDIHWIAYAQTNYDPLARSPKLPTNDSIRKDLSVLGDAGCDGLVTYGASLSQIVSIAQALKFRALLIGIWDPTNNEELRLARRSAAMPDRRRADCWE